MWKEYIDVKLSLAGNLVVEQAFLLSSSGGMGDYHPEASSVQYSRQNIGRGDCLKRKACCFRRGPVCNVSHRMCKVGSTKLTGGSLRSAVGLQMDARILPLESRRDLLCGDNEGCRRSSD